MVWKFILYPSWPTSATFRSRSWTLKFSICFRSKFLVKIFTSLYLLNFKIDLVDTLHVDRYWSENLFSTIMTQLRNLQVKVMDFEIFLMCQVKVFASLYLLNFKMDLVDTLHVARYWSEVLCYTLMTRLRYLQIKVIDFELSFYVSGKILTSLYFLSLYKNLVDTMPYC